MTLKNDQLEAVHNKQDAVCTSKSGRIILQGYLRKLKRMKKKYFILFGESEHLPARLDYYDSEKKWKSGQSPKRSIGVKSCFNINRRIDSKQKYVIALYTKEDSFSIALDSEDELETWLNALLKIQYGENIAEDQELKPMFEHVWEVNVRNKELGTRKNILGPHRLCLTSRVLKLVKMPIMENTEILEFPLMNIRRCGHSSSLFFMELGRGSVTGAGELWMESEEAAIAQSMHGAIITAMKNCAKEDLGPRQRTRSSSANEQNRPANLTTWTQPAINSLGTRGRADSVPSNPRTRTISEGPIVTPPGFSGGTHFQPGSSELVHPREVSSSPPMCSALASPNSYIYSNDSAGSSLSIDEYEPHTCDGYISNRNRYSHTATPENSLPKESTILEEKAEDYIGMNIESHDDYLNMTPHPPPSSSPSTRASSSSIGRSTSISSGRGGKIRSSVGPPGKPLHQNPYVGMTSPVTSSWSPPNASDCYLPMLPGSHCGPGSIGNRSGTHTRSSSFGDDIPDGYVPMAPQSVTSTGSAASREEEGGYMDMRSNRSIPREVHGGKGRLSPASSSSLASSITSGTPSIAFGTSPVIARLQEYHLEKVASLLTPSEDDDELSSLRCRESRAYSVGSRPDLRRKLGKIDPVAISSCSESARVRAYSVGSRVGSGGNKSSGNFHNSSQTNMEPTSDKSPVSVTSNASDEEQRKKSLSVPMLGSSPISVSWSNSTGTFLRNLLGQSANRRGNDLMEIQFSKENSSKASYVSTDSIGSNAIDRPDGKEQDLSYQACYGSSDSVSRASVSSTNSSGGRPRTNSRSLVNRTSGKQKLESFRSRERKARPELDRLESIVQGRDQDYIEYEDKTVSIDVLKGTDSAIVDAVDSTDITKRIVRSLSKSKSDKQKTKGEQNCDSGDEYVELAKPSSAPRKTSLRSTVPRLSVTGSENSLQSPGSDYMTMDYGKPVNPMLENISCHIGNIPQQQQPGYMDMTFGTTKKLDSTRSASISDNESYLPMDFTPTVTPRSSRNSSRQSSQVDLSQAATFSPPKGTQTPRSGSQSARHSRTEETLYEHYMEMSNIKSESSQNLRSVNMLKAPLPNTSWRSENEASLALTDSESTASKVNKAGMFLSNLLGLKNTPMVVSKGSNLEGSGTLPRSSKSMPPSPFSSLKRPKSSKKRRSVTTNPALHLVSPVSPEAESVGSIHQQRSNSWKGNFTLGSHPVALFKVSSIPPRGLDSPVTPPSPSVECRRLQFSLPTLGMKPTSTQPITISLQRPPSSFTPRGSPVPSGESIRRGLTSCTPEADEYVLPQMLNASKYSSSPVRPVTMPTLSPLPEVNPNVEVRFRSLKSQMSTSKSNAAEDSSYINMDFSKKSHVTSRRPSGPLQTSSTLDSVCEKGTVSVEARENKENNEVKSHNVESITASVSPSIGSNIAANGTTEVSSVSKPRATSMEKIVGALDKVKIGPKRHSSGDKPLKRTSGTLIYRSNSYQPMGSRVVIAGSKSASLFPLLNDIPAGKIAASTNDGGIQFTVNASKSSPDQNLGTKRASSSSLASLSEDLIVNAEMQAVSWTTNEGVMFSATPTQSSTAVTNLSPAPFNNSSSPSPSSSASRPPSVLSEKEIHYAQLDLAPPIIPFRSDESDDIPKSPRNPRPTSATGFADPISPAVSTAYAQIDFKKSEGLKNTSATLTRDQPRM